MAILRTGDDETLVAHSTVGPHPILETVLSEDGGGSFSYLLREALRNQTAAAAANAKAAGDTGPGANPKYENFNAGSPASRGEARGGLRRNRVLTRGYCTRSLRRSRVSAASSRRRRRLRPRGAARVTALVHFAGAPPQAHPSVRRPPGAAACLHCALRPRGGGEGRRSRSLHQDCAAAARAARA